MLIPSFRCGQIFPKEPHHVVSQRYKPGFVELCPADGNHALIEIHVRKAQPDRFTHAHARSVEEQDQGAKRNGRRPTPRMSLTARHGLQQQTELSVGVDIWNESLYVLGSCRRHRNRLKLPTAAPVYEEVS